VVASFVEELLASWREGERVLADLPSLDPDRAAVEQAVDQLRRKYRELADESRDVQAHLAESRDVIDAARAVIAQARQRTGGSM
jgi:chromosome segregation ATPase